MAGAGSVFGQPIQFPTANRALLERDGGERFFVGTIGKPWTSGTFGCVRTGGQQMHEGLDIRCVQRDSNGEPIDSIFAAASGTVAYLNDKAGLSNYGKYLVLKHHIEGLEVFTLYAHLRQMARGLKIGDTVKAGQVIATMGRTTNTREGISKERAHLHFEVALLLNDRFPGWYKNTFPTQRNDHQQWNGYNLAGLDPGEILRRGHTEKQFSLLKYVREQAELCRVWVRDANFDWIKRYPILIRRNAVAEREGVAGFEVALNYNGVPFQMIPRAASEMNSKARLQLLSVNEAEAECHPCRHLVTRKSGQWILDDAGMRLLELLTY
jgi:peptidoglycan LD-endopeptidase LytH